MKQTTALLFKYRIKVGVIRFAHQLLAGNDNARWQRYALY